MKQKTASSKIYAICIALALLVLLAVNVTYAYFSANKIIQSEGAKMGVTIIKWSQGGWSTSSDIVNVTAVNQDESSLTDLSRGSTFLIKNSSGTTLDQLGLWAPESTVYARFWVDAYVENNATNYGQYFELVLVDTSKITKELRSGSENNISQINYIYYINKSFTSYNRPLISSMKLAEDAPMELLNQSISISINVEAVQANKDAVQALWGDSGDWRGYLTSWLS